MPSASIRQFMLLAVNMPEHEPQDGQAIVFQHLQARLRRSCRPGKRPTPSKTEIRSTTCAIGRAPGGHRPAGDENRRDVDPHRRHQHPRDDLVAVGDADHAVEAVGLDHRLHAVGDQFARGQGILHPCMAHGDAVIHADGVELEGNSAGSAHGFLHQPAEFLQVDMPGDDVDVGVDDGNEGLPHVGVGYADRLEQGAVGRPCNTHPLSGWNAFSPAAPLKKIGYPYSPDSAGPRHNRFSRASGEFPIPSLSRFEPEGKLDYWLDNHIWQIYNINQ